MFAKVKPRLAIPRKDYWKSSMISRSGAGVGVGMMRGAGADTRIGALCAFLTLERDPMCFSDTSKKPYVLFRH